MSGGKSGFPGQTGKDTDQPLAQDHHGGTRVTWNHVDELTSWLGQIGNGVKLGMMKEGYKM